MGQFIVLLYKHYTCWSIDQSWAREGILVGIALNSSLVNSNSLSSKRFSRSNGNLLHLLCNNRNVVVFAITFYKILIASLFPTESNLWLGSPKFYFTKGCKQSTRHQVFRMYSKRRKFEKEGISLFEQYKTLLVFKE